MQHTRLLIEILTDSESPEIKDMKLAVAVHTKNLFRVISAVGHN